MIPSLDRAPERVLRAGLLTALLLAAATPMLLLSPRVAWWQDPWLGLLLILGAGLNDLYGELRPEISDGWLAERTRRYAPGAVGLVLVSALVFPTFGTWPILWLFFFVNVALLAFAFINRVRVACLCVSSALGLGMLVVDDSALWSLPVIGLTWLLLPALDRYARTRMRLYQRPAPALPALAAACALLFALGLGAFAAATALLPPTTRDYEVLDLLAPRGGVQGSARGGQLPELPGVEMFVLLAIAGLALYLGSVLSDRKDGELEEPEDLEVRGSAAAPLRNLRRAINDWPAGPRRDLVLTYLEHLRRLEGRGHPCPPDGTPLAYSQRLAAQLDDAPGEVAAELAALFGRARWAPDEVRPEDARQAAAQADAIEGALRPRS